MTRATDDQETWAVVARNLRRLADERGMDEAALARATGETAERIGDLLAGRSDLEIALMKRLAQALETSWQKIVEGL